MELDAGAPLVLPMMRADTLPQKSRGQSGGREIRQAGVPVRFRA